MMQLMQKFFVCLLLGVLCCSTAWAMDFARMSNQELADLQGAIQNAPEPEQLAFRQEWEKRLKAMSEEEKKLYALPEQQPGDEEKLKKPYIQGRGYESQGTGTVIYGGQVAPGQGGSKKSGK